MKKLYVIGGLLSGVLFLPWSAHAAVLSLIPERTEVVRHETMRVAVVLDTEDEEVNALEITIPVPDGVSVKTIEYGNSVVSLWIEPPTVKCQNKNDACQMNFVGGMPGGFRGQGTLATIVLETANDATELQFSANAQILLNDGEGTPANVIFEGTKFAARNEAPLIVTSKTHQNQDEWYQKRTAQFSWKQKSGATYSMLLDDGPETVPDTIPEEEKVPVKILNVPDGIHYFHVREAVDGVWEAPAHFRIQVDGASPERFTVEREGDELAWSTTDKASGIDYYTVAFAPRPLVALWSTRAVSPHQISKLAVWFGGIYTIRAIDKAGNEISAAYTFSGSAIGPILITILLIIVLGALGMFLWRWRQKNIR